MTELTTRIPQRHGLLGAAALTAAIVLFAVSIVASIVIGTSAADLVGDGVFSVDSNSSDPAERAVAVSIIAHEGIGTAIGVAAIVAGIVAIVTRKGRTPGILAIIIAALTPGISLVVFFAILTVSAPR